MVTWIESIGFSKSIKYLSIFISIYADLLIITRLFIIDNEK